jgi:hypothetical protein
MWRRGREVSDGSFEISVDPSRRRLDIVLRGLWTDAIAARFATDLDVAIADMRRAGIAPGEMRSLLDMSDLSVIPAGLTPTFGVFASQKGRESERVAVVYSSTLARIQFRRLAHGDSRYAFFAEMAEAMRWLETP